MAWTYYQKESKANVHDNFACLKIIVWKLTKLILSGRCGFAVNKARIIRLLVLAYDILYFHQTSEVGAFQLLQPHADVLYGILQAWDEHVF